MYPRRKKNEQKIGKEKREKYAIQIILGTDDETLIAGISFLAAIKRIRWTLIGLVDGLLQRFCVIFFFLSILTLLKEPAVREHLVCNE